MKVLVAEDDPDIQVILKMVLTRLGKCDVSITFQGDQVFPMAKANHPGLILLDVIMPTIKGREVCRRLKQSPVTAHIPVLFLTAKDSDDDVKAEMAAGAVGHVTKPINSASLVRLIKKTITL